MTIRFETARLRIRPFEADDLHDYMQLSHEAFGAPLDEDAARQTLTWAALNYRQLARLNQPPYGDYAVTLADTGALVGAVGLVPATIPWHVLEAFRPPGARPDALISPEFGLFWMTRAAHRGQGIATEAATGLIDWIYRHVHARRIVATTEHDNAASQAVMRKLGMTLHANTTVKPFWFEVVGVHDRKFAAGRD
jgi:[ribosomal protein S5]-alanine N-acetyltransferase